MYTPDNNDRDQIDNTNIELSIELSELTAQFDDAMCRGEELENARNLYHQIKELTSRIAVLDTNRI